jgi:hypothetical protein
MALAGNTNLTHSGFAKNDVYRDVLDTMHRRDYERMCYLVAELACTRREIKPLTLFLLDEFIANRLSSQARVLEKVAEYVNVLQGFSPKDTHKNPGFQRVMAAFSMLIAMQSPRQHDFYRPRVGQDEVDALTRKAGAVALPPRALAVVNSGAVAPLLGVLARLVLAAKVRGAMAVASYLVAAFPADALPDIVFHEVRDVKNKRDPVWYVWRLLLAVAEDQALSEVRSYVLTALRLYAKHATTRATRASRVNLLMYSIAVCCNCAVKTRAVPLAALQHVAERIHVVYEDTLGLAPSDGGGGSGSMAYLDYVPSR